MLRNLIAQLDAKWPAVEKPDSGPSNGLFAWKSGVKVSPDIREPLESDVGLGLLESAPSNSGLLFGPIDTSYEANTARFWADIVKTQYQTNEKGQLHSTSVLVVGKLKGDIGAGSAEKTGCLSLVVEGASGVAKPVTCPASQAMSFCEYTMIAEPQLPDSAAALLPKSRMKTAPALYEYIAIQPLYYHHYYHHGGSPSPSPHSMGTGGKRKLMGRFYFLCQVVEKEIGVSSTGTSGAGRPNYILKVKLPYGGKDGSSTVMTIHSSLYAIYSLFGRIPAGCSESKSLHCHAYDNLWLANRCLVSYASSGGNSDDFLVTTGGTVPRWYRLVAKATDMLRSHWSCVVSHSLAAASAASAAGASKRVTSTATAACLSYCVQVLETILTFQLRPLVVVASFYQKNSPFATGSAKQKGGGGEGGRLLAEYVALFHELCYLPVLMAISGHGIPKSSAVAADARKHEPTTPVAAVNIGPSVSFGSEIGTGTGTEVSTRSPSLRQRMDHTAKAIRELNSLEEMPVGGMRSSKSSFGGGSPSTPKKTRPVAVQSVRLNLLQMVDAAVHVAHVHSLLMSLLAELPAVLIVGLDNSASVVAARGRLDECYSSLGDKINSQWKLHLRQCIKNDVDKPSEWKGTVILRKNSSFTIGIQAIIVQLFRFLHQLTSVKIRAAEPGDSVGSSSSSGPGYTGSIGKSDSASASNSASFPLLVAIGLVNTCLQEVVLHYYGKLNTSRTKVCQWYRDVVLVLFQAIRFYREIEFAANAHTRSGSVSAGGAELAMEMLFGASYSSLNTDESPAEDSTHKLVVLLRSLATPNEEPQLDFDLATSEKACAKCETDTGATDSGGTGSVTNVLLQKELRECLLLMELSAVMLMYRCAPVYIAMGAIQVSKKLPSVLPEQSRVNMASGVYCILGERGNSACSSTDSIGSSSADMDMAHPDVSFFGSFNPGDASAVEGSKAVSIDTVCELLLVVCTSSWYTAVAEAPTAEKDHLAFSRHPDQLAYFETFFKQTDGPLGTALHHFSPFPKYAPLSVDGVTQTVDLLRHVCSLVHIRFSLEHIMWSQLRNRYELIPHSKDMSLSAQSRSPSLAPVAIEGENSALTPTSAGCDFTSGKIFPLVSAEEEERCAEVMTAILDWYAAPQPDADASLESA